MTEHLPECYEPFAIPRTCVVCDALRACEQRVREDERSSNFTPDDHSNGMTEAYQRGLDAAREVVEEMDLHGCLPRPLNCNCIGPKVIAAIDAIRGES